MAWDEDLEAALRDDLAGVPFTTVRMFGGLAFMSAGGHMICGLFRGGVFLRAAAGTPGTGPLVMGASGRAMSGFVLLDEETAATPALRRPLVAESRAAAESRPPKPPTTKSKPPSGPKSGPPIKQRGQGRKTPL